MWSGNHRRAAEAGSGHPVRFVVINDRLFDPGKHRQQEEQAVFSYRIAPIWSVFAAADRLKGLLNVD
jgi:hypothetical protein